MLRPMTRTRSAALATAWLLAAFLVIAPAKISAQCALCRDALDAAAPQTRAAMNIAIAGLAVAPYAVAGLAVLALSPRLRGYVRGLARRALRRANHAP